MGMEMGGMPSFIRKNKDVAMEPISDISNTQAETTPKLETPQELQEKQLIFMNLLGDMEARKMKQRESAGLVGRTIERTSNWYKKLDETPSGRVKKKCMEAAFSGALYLGTANYMGMIAGNTALVRWISRVGINTGFQAGSEILVNKVTKKTPDLVDKVENIFKKKNQSATAVPSFDPENTTSTGSGISFEAQNTNATRETVSDDEEEIKQVLKRLKYSGMLLGSSFVWLTGGGLFLAGVTGFTMLFKEELNNLVKKEIEKQKAKLENLVYKINLTEDQEKFQKMIDLLEKDAQKILKVIGLLEQLRSLLKGATTFTSGLVGTNVTSDASTLLGGSIRRAATSPLDILRDKIKDKYDKKGDGKGDEGDQLTTK